MHPARSVRAVRIEGSILILDLRSESYFVLDPVATDFWEALVGAEDPVRALLAKYRVDEERLRRDLEAQARRWTEAGFLQERAPASEPWPARRAGRAPRRLLAWRAWWSLFRTWRRLARLGFSAAYEEAARTPVSSGPVGLPAALGAFARAENFFHMRKAPQDCLPRSLALFRFLRRCGIPAEHRIGVRRFPFGAHAWVEVDGRIVHDRPDQPRLFTTIARIA